LEARVAINVELSCGDGLGDGASRLALVGTIGKSARSRQFLDLPECIANRLVGVPQRQRPQARGVDQQCTTGKPDKLARRRGVAALPVCTDLPGQKVDRPSPEAVRKRRLAGTGG